MNFSKKNKIVLLFLTLVIVLVSLLTIISSSFFQKKAFSHLSKKIQEQYNITINSSNFYYNFFSNKIHLNFLIRDDYQQPMILIPQVSISTEKNLFFSQDNFEISEIEFNDMDIFIKKYKNDSVSNIQRFFKKISTNNKESINSFFIENIKIDLSNVIYESDFDTLSLKEIKILCNNFSISNNKSLNIENILIDNKNFHLTSSLNTNFSNSDEFSFKGMKSKIQPSNYSKLKNLELDEILFSGDIIIQRDSIRIKKAKFNYKNSYLEFNLLHNKLSKITSFEVNESLFKETDINSILIYNKLSSNLLKNLGDLSYKGKNELFENNLKLLGDLKSKIGSSNFDLSILIKDNLLTSSYEGLFSLIDFDLGNLLEKSNFGLTNLTTSIKGSGFNKNNFVTNIDVNCKEVSINNYNYKNIQISGLVSSEFFDGIIRVKDKNFKANFKGLADYSNKIPRFKFSSNISKINFRNIKMPINKYVKNFSGDLVCDISGDSFNNLNGYLIAENLYYKREKKQNLNKLTLNFSNINNEKNIIIDSDIGSGSFKGDYNFSSLRSYFKRNFNSLLTSSRTDFLKKKNFDIQLNFKESSFFTNLFFDNFNLGKCFISLIKNKNNLVISGKLNNFKYLQNSFNELSLNFNHSNEKDFEFLFFSQGYQNKKNNFFVDSLLFNSNSNSNKINYDFTLVNINNDNDIDAFFSGNLLKEKKNIITFDNSTVSISGDKWTVSPNSIFTFTDIKTFNIKDFSLESNDQSVQISGFSENFLKLYFDFKNFNLTTLNKFKSDRSTKINGLVDGTMWYSSEKKPMGGYLKISDFSLNNINLGNLIINTQSNEKRKYLTIDGYLKPEQNKKTIDLNGTISLDKRPNMNIFLDFNGQSSKFIGSLISSISDTNGKLFGKANIYGPHDKFYIDADLIVKDFSFGVPYLNTTYLVKEDYNIICKRNDILLDTTTIFDDLHNTNALLFGNLTHSNSFKKIWYDINIKSNNLYCLNTTSEQNEVYYGKVFAKGDINVSGKPGRVNFNIDAETKNGTKFNIPLSKATEISNYSNLKLFSSNNLLKENEINNKDITNKNIFKMNFNLNLKSNAQVQIIYDEKIGDIIKGSGDGKLKLKIDENKNFEMYGNVLIKEGEYLYTMQNLLNKNFTIESGGSLIWDGSPYDIMIDFVALYKLKTSLNLLDSDYKSSTKVPVLCKMHMTKSLLKPSVDFIIEIPSASDVALTKLYQLTDSEEKKLQQFIFLLGANSFLIQESTENYISSGLTTTGTELLSNQISNWLSQITDDFDLGFRWTPGSTDSLTTDEIKLALSMKLLNDKLTINGNASNPSTPQAQDNTDVVSEVDIQYDLTNNLKVKAFNRTDEYDPISGEEFRYEQGVSIFFEREFNSFFDLFRKKNKKKEKRKKKKN
ncbi:MAG: hypothetical protein CMP68_00835 [Flavobacteriales bacterium]|nr:hypothetical protein [Flavobacteriales bacterium]